jgi:23S rRNA (adenine2503-C2)-methyltransferase
MTRAVTELSDAELTELVTARGTGKPFQARQLLEWVYRHGAPTWDDCHTLPRALRETLAHELAWRGSRVVAAERSDDGCTKLLLRLRDGESIETVIIPDGDRTTLCVSTQVGCPVACVFCASGLDGVRRNLTRGEIVEQVLHARDLLRASDPNARLTNLVVMGMGEPLLNLDNLLAALERIHDPAGLNLGARRITVSTSGYPERMRAFADRAGHPYSLAVSLHAADDGLRRRLVPTARATVAEIVAAARAYFLRRGREVTFEVVLLDGINDRPADARTLARALRGFPCTVNLIPWNPVDRIRELRRPAELRVDAFAAALRGLGISVTVRRQRGADRSAACGQLRFHADATGS